MIDQNKITNTKILTVLISLLFVFTTISTAQGLHLQNQNRDIFDDFDWENGIPDLSNVDISALDPNSAYPSDFDVGQFLSDNDNAYQKVWDPWVSKAAIHAVATYNDGDMLALAGGYLYDNQIHLYRWNYLEDRYDLVWEIGGGIFQSDVTSLAFADTDYNDLTEIIAGGEDGVLYVFEQRHLYDPYTNMENQFDLVWKSPRLGRIFDVMVYDSDQDFRQDIIVGTGDTVRWYEYDTHGSYPFGEDHFIEFREVFSLQMPSQITALGVSDVNSNGLKEIATGLRNGEVHLLENDGETLLINGELYPIVQDNAYVDIWNSGNVVRRPISDMEGGDLDADGEMELLIAVQGQGAYVLDTIDGIFGLFRIQREFQSWESNPVEIYPLDVYTDVMIDSSSWFNNNDLPDQNDWNVYFENATDTYVEPLNYTNGLFTIFPYSSYSVMNQQGQPDGRYTTFDATILSNLWGSAWAVYDWGNDEEATGNGISSIPEMKIWVENTSVPADQINISISADNVHFYKINASLYVKADPSGKFYTVEVDPTMVDSNINFYRYIKFEVLSEKLNVDVFETTAWNNPIYDALSVETGFMTFKNEETPTPVGYIGTIDGAILALTWDSIDQKYVIRWDSWNDERWKLKTNLFDLELIKQTGRFPAWIDKGTISDTLDLRGPLPEGDGGVVVSWTAENFYNSRNENFLEYIVISSTGRIFVYQQTSPFSAPVYNPQLTKMLFGDLDIAGGRTVGPSWGGVQAWLYDLNSAGINYFAMSILPIDVTVDTDSGHAFDPYSNGFMLYLSSWDGSLGNLDQGNLQSASRGEVDVSLWYFITDENVDTSQNLRTCDAFSLPVCSYFQPLRQSNNFNLFYDLNSQFINIATLSTQELTGQIWDIFSDSTWIPKVAAGNFITNSHNDYVVTNGKLTLMEAQFGLGSTQTPEFEFDLNDTLPEQSVIISQSDNVLSEFNFVVRGGYFDEINANSKGRHWSNANPVDFDGDGDMDLILGFATYSDLYFGLDKVTFGATYWENQGSREEPVWVELPLAITNTDPDSGFGAQNYTDPLFIYDEYDMSKVSSSALGYHPSFRTDRPQRLLMWQPIDHTSIFTGSIHTFFSEYDHPSSLLVATYPEAKRIDINLRFVENGEYDTEINYGFHVFETWDNSEELNDWTLSLSTADLDEDGKNEIIVGDFNNNIYVFEHLTNNTYKRAFKSFDVNRTIKTDISPYAFEQFEGISGEFSRTLFDHIEFLIAGFDLNNNFRQEFIAATENMIFIFEATTSPTGRIIDDTYQLIKIIDLLDFPTLSNQIPSQTKISAMTWADDLTQDGRKELIIAVTSGLLVLEIDQAPTPKYKESSEFVTEEIFFGDNYNLMGLYDFPGNYFIHPELVIETILVEDLDSDGFLDLVLAGLDTSPAKPLYSGFLTIMEWKGSSFRKLEEEGVFNKMLQYNPIHDLAVDDTDFDGHKELLVGHSYGIDIYEFTADNTIELMEVITSNPHYQFPDRYYYSPITSQIDIHKDVIRSPDGLSLIMVFSNATGLWYTTSTDEGETWATQQEIKRFSVAVPGGTPILGLQPSLSINSLTNEVWLSYIIRQFGIDRYDIWVIRSVQPGENVPEWFDVDEVIFGNSDDNMPSPRLFNIAGNIDPDVMGLVHIVHENDIGVYENNAMKFLKIKIGSGIIGTYYADWANSLVIPNNFAIHSLDIVQLDGLASRKYGVVFAGYPFSEAKSLDLDLFYDEIILDETAWTFNVTTPNRIYASGMAARNPSIIQEHDTGNLLVTYEEQSLRPYGGLWAVWSNDGGFSWNGPYDMSHPLGIDMPSAIEALPTNSGESYIVASKIGLEPITDFESRIPVVVPGNNRGFTMVYNVRVEFQVDIKDSTGAAGNRKGSSVGLCSQDSKSILSAHQVQYDNNVGCKQNIELNMIASAINPMSNFTWYELGSVSEIVVGDTDRDSRHEILVASGKQAFLFEFAHNSDTFILHEQKWKSDTYDRDITGIAISDVNGNGFPEIVVESHRGIVQTFEVINTLMKTSDLLYSKQEMILHSPETSGDNSIMQIETVDLNSDNIEDFVYATLGGFIIAIDGSDYSTLWTETYSAPTYALSRHYAEPEIQMRIVYDLDSGSPNYIAISNNADLFLYNPLTGSNITINFGGSSEEYVSVLRTGDIISGGSEEIIIGLFNGAIMLLDATTLNIIWTYDFGLGMVSTEDNDPNDIRVAKFTSTNIEIAVMNIEGDIIVLDGSGIPVWQVHVPSYTRYAGLAIVDSNLDGYSDIIVGNNITFSLNGRDGTQLWNKNNELTEISQNFEDFSVRRPFIGNQDPTLYDVDKDGVLDIIYSLYHENSDNTIYAQSGRNGVILWTYSVSIGGSIQGFDGQRYAGIVKLFSLADNRNIIVFQNSYEHLDQNTFTVLLDPDTGIAIGGIKNQLSGAAVAVSNLGSSEPLILVGDILGNVTIYSLWEGQPVVTSTPPSELRDQPFFRLGTDFTRRTEYLVYDFVQSPSLQLDGDGLGDGVDDVIVIDDDYIGAGDTYTLLNDPNFNEVEWSIEPSTLPMGRYLGGAKLANIDGDVELELVAPFEKYLIAIDLVDGTVKWKVEHFQFDKTNQTNDFHFQIADVDTNPGLELVYTRFLWYGEWPISEIAILDGDNGEMLYNQYIPYSKDAVFNVADLDNTGKSEIILAVNYFFNPSISLVVVFGEMLEPKDNVSAQIITGMFPITEIAVGNFDSVDPEDEFIFFFEMAKLDLPDIIYSLIGFPTLFIQFDWNSGYELPENLINTIGISPSGEPTVNYWIDDRGSILNMIVESPNGDLFNYNFDGSSVLMQENGVIRDKAIPYARTTFVPTNLCGSQGFITLVSANTLECYTNMDFSNLNLEISLTLEFSVVQDMVIADLDEDNIDDLIVTSFSGHVWVILSTDQIGPLLQLNGPIDPELVLTDAKMIDQPPAILLVSVNLFIGIIVLLKKKKKLQI